MRAQSFSSALLLAVSLHAFADVGGGRGHPATPWREEGPESVAELEESKARAAQFQTLSVPAVLLDEDSEYEYFELSNVAVIPLPLQQADVRRYELAGTLDSGEAVTISFSQIENITVLSKADETVRVSVTVWPDIAPEALLELQPTYEQLNAGYRREVELDLELVADDGRPLGFADDWETTLPLADLPAGTRLGFYEGHPHNVHPLRFWWAIPSVANDETYPFRLIPAR